MTTPTFAEGDLCRVKGWNNQVFRIRRFHLTRGEVDVWGGPPGRHSMRTTTTDRLLPARPQDAARFGLTAKQKESA